MKRVIESDYPIYADMVRKVGFKMGKGLSALHVKDRDTGIEIRDADNRLVTDTDFRRVGAGFDRFSDDCEWQRAVGRQPPPEGWDGATIGDVLRHPALDLKPRRLMVPVLRNVRSIAAGEHVALSEIARLVKTPTDIVGAGDAAKLWRMVAGQDIRAVEGVVTPSAPMRAWQIAEKKQRKLYRLRDGDIIVGLVRPERRNIGLLLASGDDIVGVPDGIAVVRVKPKLRLEYPQDWLFAVLRSEACRLQFWTESGGTSYGKLSDAHIENVLIPVPSAAERQETAERVRRWAIAAKRGDMRWAMVGTDADRRPIVNSSGFGLIETDDTDDGGDSDE